MIEQPRARWLLPAMALLTIASLVGCGAAEPPVATTTEDLIEAKRQRTAAVGGDETADGGPLGDLPIKGARP